ncbi:MAG: hypothetical protein ACO3AF_05815 [Flavobacteriales bacterium]
MTKFNPTLSSLRSKIEKLMLMYKALEEEVYRLTQENEVLRKQAGLQGGEALPDESSGLDLKAIHTIAHSLRQEIELLRQELQDQNH